MSVISQRNCTVLGSSVGGLGFQNHSDGKSHRKSSTRHIQTCQDTSFLSLLSNLFCSGNSGSHSYYLITSCSTTSVSYLCSWNEFLRSPIAFPSLKIITFTSCQINENVYNQKTKEGNFYSNI